MLDCDARSSELGTEEFDNLLEVALVLNVDTPDIELVLKSYDEHLQFIFGLLVPFDHAVFKGLSLILSEGLNKLIGEKRQLAIEECCFLKKIPVILYEYAFIPTSKIPDVHLLKHFKNQNWIRPVTDEEEKKFISFLVDNHAVFATNDKIQSVQYKSSLVENTESDVDQEIDISDLVNIEDEANFIPSPETENLNYFLENSSVVENKLDDIESGVIDSSNVSDVELCESSVIELEFVEGDDLPEALDIVDLSLYEGSDIKEEGVETEINLMDFVDDQQVNEFTPESMEYQASIEIEKNSSSIDISLDQKELVALIVDELNEIIQDKDLITIESTHYSSELKEHLISIADQIENISNAVDLIGLEGLGDASRMMSENIHMLASKEISLTIQQGVLIQTWPEIILSYLNNIANQHAITDVIQYLKDFSWPDPLSAEAEVLIEALLSSPQMKEEEKRIRQSVASAEDMSLLLPDDVNPELLEGLLQDLPVQSGEFSVAIQNLQNQDNIEYLEVAQRIAHTLKGAGNVVGVKGIANLTHNLEDILEIQSKANKLPSGDLLNVLIDAADCLETMSEALLGIDEPPDNGLVIYQSVLDWANKLDKQGATDIAESVINNDVDFKSIDVSSDTSSDEKIIKSTIKKPLNIENMLRVPVKLADDLLRLAGENLISTSQIQEYIKIIQTRYKSLKNQDQTLQKFAYDLEHIVDVQGVLNNSSQSDDNDGFDPLELDQFHELHSMSRRLIELSADSIELTQILEKDYVELQNLVINQDKLQKENEQLVLRTRMVSASTIIPRLKRGVKQACRLTGKQVDLDVLDNDTYMDSEVLNSLIEPLMHILRNSVGHGIETAKERKDANKSVNGNINLVFLRRGDQIVIDIKDDGKGLNLTKIRDKAISLGLANSSNDVTEENIQKFILQPGFSTRKEVSQMSGRGIGLDVVNSKVRELKGSIEIRSEEGSGCQFLLTLPISSFSVHSLLVRVRDNLYAISNRGLEEILYPGLGELQKVGQETMFKLDDQFYNISLVESLLNMPEDRRKDDRANRPVILVKDDSGVRSAVLVQEVLDSRDVVVKSMGPFVPKIPGVVGATVLGDGSIVPVIDLPELMQSVKGLDDQIRYDNINSNLQEVKKLPYVLIVDDSLSARKSLAQFVEDLGLYVRTARDGMEAVSLIDVQKPDLILVDMEMPRMNGLELTSHIRANENTQNMPVIMITSRSTDKHRKAAMDKGVDHYMVKPFAEDELANHINSALKTA